MSPFVVPVHRVKTWDLLHKELQDFFNLDIFNPSVRIIDRQGNSILPSVWKNILEPDMTIIVDTCSLLADNSPVISEASKSRSFPPPASPAYTVRESEDSCYDNVGSTFITPRGVIGQAVPMMPPNTTATAGIFNVHNRNPSMGRLKHRAHENEERGSASVGMFTGMWSKQPNTQISDSSQRRKEEQSTFDKGIEKSEQEHGAGTLGNKQKSKHLRTTVSRFARALLRILSVGTIQISSKGNKDSEKPKRGVLEKTRRTITMETIENNPAKNQSNFHHRIPSKHQKVSISSRRGIPSLPPVVPPLVRTNHEIEHIVAIPSEPTIIKTEPRRSRSLPHLKLPSIIAFPKATLSSSAPSPAGSIKRRPRSKSFTFIRNSSKLSVISPPIPPRPSLELGTNAQYKILSMDKATIQEMLNDMDGVTLGSKTRSRRGTVDTVSTPISLSPTLVSVDKPLPALPFKFSAFPAPSPPRSPLIMSGWQRGVLMPMAPIYGEEHGRPATAVTRSIAKVTLRKIASTDFGAIKKNKLF
jgi:hypothetical protein